MNKFDRRFWKSNAEGALRRAGNSPRKLALIHSAVSAGVALLIVLLSFLLNQQMAGTGGLSGIGNRSLLATAQSLLQLANTILLPFWEIGLLWVFLSISRGQKAENADLLTGFHRFGPVLRGKLLQGMHLVARAFIGCYLGTILFSFSPFSMAYYEACAPYLESGVLDYAVMMEDQALMGALVWAVPFMAGGVLVATVPLYYRLRLMDYVLLDQPEMGAFHALRESKIMMRGKRWGLFKLDLSFWWFYLLEVVISLVCYGDMILPALDVELGMSADAAYFAFYALALVCQIGLYTWKKPKLLTTYAQFYNSMLPKEEPEEQ